MRISDLSSDVCSSDLINPYNTAFPHIFQAVLAPAVVEFAAEVVCSIHFALYTTLDDRKGHDLTIEHGTARGVLLKAPGLDVPTRLIAPAPSAAPLIRRGRRRPSGHDRTEQHGVGEEWVRTCSTR